VSNAETIKKSDKLPAIPYGFAKQHGILLGAINDNSITLLHKASAKQDAISEVRRVVQRPIQLEEITNDVFDEKIAEQYESKSQQAMDDIADLGSTDDLALLSAQLSKPQDLLESDNDAPIIRLLNALFAEAIREKASDIHLDPDENNLLVRFRIDGVLRETLKAPAQIVPAVVSRIKVMANLDIAEKRLPQDGRLSLRISEHRVDVRVSTLPSSHGERVVLRLLDKKVNLLDLEHLGMPENLLAATDRLIHQPHGIILVTGPTGSGKSTTLYAGLSRLDSNSLNILTIEDPVEYDLNGIGQTQVNAKVDLTFARGLRAILRQDPDIVMVGEIRDLETAQIAVQASLTGHLVLSTLHTNSAVGAIARLRDMGIEPFLLSSSLIGIVAQRLIRLLCTACKQSYSANSNETECIGKDKITGDLFRPMGCQDCKQTGYSGRTGIYELIEVDRSLSTLIHDDAGEPSYEKVAHKNNNTLRENAMQLVIEGKTSLQEVLRVTRETE